MGSGCRRWAKCSLAELVERAAAVAVAAFLKSDGDYAGRSVALLICGGNAEPEFAVKVKA